MGKKTLNSLTVTVIVALFCTYLISCGNDDDEIADTSIVGNWEETDYGDGIWVWTFKSNGKGTLTVTNRPDYGSYSWNFTFSFDGQNLIISGKDNGKSIIKKYYVVIDGKTMIWIKDGKYRINLKKK